HHCSKTKAVQKRISMQQSYMPALPAGTHSGATGYVACLAGEFSRIRGSGPVFQQGYANSAAMEEHWGAQGANRSL
ncbi:hypothetical protein ACQPWO_32015, partial [Escherichia coli]